MNKPDFLQKGALIKVQHWFGEVVDVAISEDRIMVLVTSPKGVWRNHPAEWLEYQAGQITPADPDAAVDNVDHYYERVEEMLNQLKELKKKWKTK